jgi:hypothetical protein
VEEARDLDRKEAAFVADVAADTDHHDDRAQREPEATKSAGPE